MSIGSRIRDLRIEQGLSVDDLAKKLGKNRATVYRYESDEIDNFPVNVVGPLAEALHTTPAFIMGWTEKKEPTTNVDSELAEISKIFTSLNAENRSKLLELSRLYLEHQNKPEGK